MASRRPRSHRPPGWAPWASRKYEVLVNLAPPQSMGSIANEGGIVCVEGREVREHPRGFHAPRPRRIFRFFSEVMKAAEGRSVFVHLPGELPGLLVRLPLPRDPRGRARQRDVEEAAGRLGPEPQWKRFIEETLKANGKAFEMM
jgi:hypothetical protein